MYNVRYLNNFPECMSTSCRKHTCKRKLNYAQQQRRHAEEQKVVKAYLGFGIKTRSHHKNKEIINDSKEIWSDRKQSSFRQ